MAKTIPNHTDIIGQPISMGNYVAVSLKNSMQVCSILKISEKMMRVVPLKSKRDYLVYPANVVVLSGEDALAYILRNI